MSHQREKNTWTVFFLIKSVDSSLDDALEMLNELKRDVEISDHVSVVIGINALRKYKESISIGVRDLFANEPDGETTLFYRLVKDPDMKNGNANMLEFLDEKIEFRLSDPDSIGGFFRHNILSKNLAERYIIFTWDHGNGYGIFSDESNGPVQETIDFVLDKANERMLFTTKPSDSLGIKVSFPDSKKKSLVSDGILTMEELAAAIELAFDGEKVEMVAMVNCYMQFFDAGYALKNNVKYFVAPETYMYFKGYNYTYFFRRLCQDPGQPSLELAKMLVSSFDFKIYQQVGDGAKARSETAVFANDLSQYAHMADLITQLAKEMDDNLDKIKPEICMACNRTVSINKVYFLVDFFYLLQNLKKVFGTIWQEYLLSEIWKLKDKIVVAEYVGDIQMKNSDSSFPAGFSICFPIRNPGDGILTSPTNFYSSTTFSKEHEWYRFAKKFR